jgi:hypothetical protein
VSKATQTSLRDAMSRMVRENSSFAIYVVGASIVLTGCAVFLAVSHAYAWALFAAAAAVYSGAAFFDAVLFGRGTPRNAVRAIGLLLLRRGVRRG